MGLFTTTGPKQVTQTRFDKYVKGRLVSGSNKFTDIQARYVLEAIRARMDKDSIHSPQGGVTEAEIEEIAHTLKSNPEVYHHVSDAQITHFKQAMKAELH